MVKMINEYNTEIKQLLFKFLFSIFYEDFPVSFIKISVILFIKLKYLHFGVEFVDEKVQNKINK